MDFFSKIFGKSGRDATPVPVEVPKPPEPTKESPILRRIKQLAAFFGGSIAAAMGFAGVTTETPQPTEPAPIAASSSTVNIETPKTAELAVEKQEVITPKTYQVTPNNPGLKDMKAKYFGGNKPFQKGLDHLLTTPFELTAEEVELLKIAAQVEHNDPSATPAMKAQYQDKAFQIAALEAKIKIAGSIIAAGTKNPRGTDHWFASMTPNVVARYQKAKLTEINSGKAMSKEQREANINVAALIRAIDGVTPIDNTKPAPNQYRMPRINYNNPAANSIELAALATSFDHFPKGAPFRTALQKTLEEIETTPLQLRPGETKTEAYFRQASANDPKIPGAPTKFVLDQLKNAVIAWEKTGIGSEPIISQLLAKSIPFEKPAAAKGKVPPTTTAKDLIELGEEKPHGFLNLPSEPLQQNPTPELTPKNNDNFIGAPSTKHATLFQPTKNTFAAFEAAANQFTSEFTTGITPQKPTIGKLDLTELDNGWEVEPTAKEIAATKRAEARYNMAKGPQKAVAPAPTAAVAPDSATTARKAGEQRALTIEQEIMAEYRAQKAAAKLQIHLDPGADIGEGLLSKSAPKQSVAGVDDDGLNI